MVVHQQTKKELNGKTITKMESVDSNSSDSGGFKEFIQREREAEQSRNEQQRVLSQPDLFEKAPQKEVMSKSLGHHQRQSSQPDYSPRSKQSFVANSAQALEQFMAATKCVDTTDDSIRSSHR